MTARAQGGTPPHPQLSFLAAKRLVLALSFCSRGHSIIRSFGPLRWQVFKRLPLWIPMKGREQERHSRLGIWLREESGAP